MRDEPKKFLLSEFPVKRPSAEDLHKDYVG